MTGCSCWASRSSVNNWRGKVAEVLASAPAGGLSEADNVVDLRARKRD